MLYSSQALSESEQHMTYLKQFIETLTNQDEYYILDTETTGLHDGEICQIAIIDQHSKVWFNNLVRTKDPIPADATAIHGITDDMVKDAPTWEILSPVLENFLRSRLVVVYNATYDRKMMHKSAERWAMPKVEWKEQTTFICAMEAFAEFYGDWNNYHKSYRWQRLAHAARYCGYDVKNSHDALADCQMTLAVVQYMLENPELHG